MGWTGRRIPPLSGKDQPEKTRYEGLLFQFLSPLTCSIFHSLFLSTMFWGGGEEGKGGWGPMPTFGHGQKNLLLHYWLFHAISKVIILKKCCSVYSYGEDFSKLVALHLRQYFMSII